MSTLSRRARRAARLGLALLCAITVAACAAQHRSHRPQAPSQAELSSVSCTAGGRCLAVGQRTAGYLLEPLTEWLAGSTARVSPAPASGPSSELTAVSCAGVRFCAAVGAAQGSALTEIWTGAGWRRGSLADSPGPSSLAGVSCPQPGFCVAVGATALEQSLVETWSGHAWTLSAAPAASPASDTPLRAVSCSAPELCVAVGTTFTAGRQKPLIDVLRQGAWTQLPVDLPQARAVTLTGVSCAVDLRRPVPASGPWCLAVGSTGASAKRRPLALAIAGSSITLVEPAVARPAGFTAVSCSTVEVCTVVGTATGRRGRETMFAQRLDRAGWGALAVDRRTRTAHPGGVSCAAARVCVAVGYELSSRRGTVDVAAERLASTRWEPIDPPPRG